MVRSLPLGATVAALRSGERSLAGHIAEVCDRIDQLDPLLLTLLPEDGRRERLLREAAALEARYPEPASRPPLYGALVGIKDIFRVAGFLTRGGTALPPELLAGPEAVCVTRLREAGALVLGKTVTTEFAMFEPGPTRNPHDREHTPGGSSSGSAAAVAAGFAPLALGSQTVGSVIHPAAFCGVTGFAPSFGRIPTDGILYFSRSVDHIGLIAQDAAGAALAASALLDGWRSDAGASALERPALGVPEGPYLEQTEPAALQAFDEQVARLAGHGYEVRRVPLLDDIAGIAQRHTWLISAEFADEHKVWFDGYGALYRPRTAAFVEQGRAVTAEQREEGRRSLAELRGLLHAAMDEHGLDAWVSPAATGPAPEGLASTGNPAMNLPWTHAGLPTITLPAGRAANGLPLGLQITARFGADEALLGWAEEMEAAVAG
ncbi:MAG: amidase [Chloroflexi bacterium]|nr:amidase [Chloroflexota bacterium]